MTGIQVDWTSWPVLTVVVGTALCFSWNDFLRWLEKRFLDSKDNDAGYEEAVSVHPFVREFLGRESYGRAMEYERANRSFGFWVRAFNRVVGFCLFTFCAYPAAFSLLSGTPLFRECQVLTLFAGYAVVSVFLDVLEAPWSLYDAFVLESRFGFNTQTFGCWLSDFCKEIVVGLGTVAVQIAFAYYGIILATKFVGLTSAWFVCLAVGGAVAFDLAYESVWINAIAPLFNKFEPLADKGLEKKILGVISAAGFSVSGIYVMDAGRRSRHGNAYFTGWGRCKRIVLYDTLLSQHSEDEIMAILGHEAGHLVHGDIFKDRVRSAVASGISTLVAVTLASEPWFYNAFGFSFVTPANVSDWYLVGFCLAGMVVKSVSWVLTPVSSWLSRKAEYAADAYAREIGYGEAQQKALIKLYTNDLSVMHDHPLCEVWSYDHPGLRNRLKALQK